MKRPSNFKNDIEIGKIGEDDFKEFLSSSLKCEHFENVTNDPFFQLLDIDYIQFTRLKEDGTQYTSEDAKEALLNHFKDSERDFCLLYEVKTDTRSEKTRNVVYELISHDKTGCAATTRADYFYYVFTDEFNFSKIKERWLIDIKKWRKFIRENAEKGEGVRLHNFDRTKDHVLNFLTNIECMKENGVAKIVQPRNNG